MMPPRPQASDEQRINDIIAQHVSPLKLEVLEQGDMVRLLRCLQQRIYFIAKVALHMHAASQFVVQVALNVAQLISLTVSIVSFASTHSNGSRWRSAHASALCAAATLRPTGIPPCTRLSACWLLQMSALKP